ncbi:thioesterase II family protein [Pleionea sp. CnH1-48]|uniref:thioesterase II family protein n=1 Tax=Pleionea sp. CnH1-48 TaxID=2954494 RepID=UPI00209817F0|nr:thioesterase domain-containing protein [Pleionea sp. CnH1-48]MCO7226510.1 thioesterase domain-containing protein [Pleionea sp. CnH1-48]
MHKDPSFINFMPNPLAPMRIFCFPYAGGSAAIYSDWAKDLPFLEVIAIQLPGRGSRLTEPLVDSIEHMANELSKTILPLLDKPFIFFGHSNGATLCYEVAKRLQYRISNVQPEQNISYYQQNERFI